MDQELIAYLESNFAQISERFAKQDEKIESFRKEVAQDIDDVRKLIRPIYSALDQRVRNLEIRKDLQGRDPIDIIRERFGKPSE